MRSRSGLAAILVLALVAHACARVDARDVKPPHHTDSGFRNPGDKDEGDPPPWVMLPFFGRRVITSLAALDVGDPPRRFRGAADSLRESMRSDAPTVTWIGHSTLLVGVDGVWFLTDPTWSSTASPVLVGPRRYVEPGLEFADLPKIDFVVVSHNHYDHLDLATLKRLDERGTRFFVPLANGYILERAGIRNIVELDWWESAKVGPVEVHCVPAQHWSRRGLFDRNKSLWSGWVVVAPSRSFYFAGDTAMFDGFEQIHDRFGPVDLAALPIGAYCPQSIMRRSHLDPEQAVEAALALRARRSVGVHYGTFDLSDEPLGEPPDRFRVASTAAGRDADTDWLLKVGETKPW